MVVYYHGQPMNSVEGLASNVWYEEADQSQTNVQTKITDILNSIGSQSTTISQLNTRIGQVDTKIDTKVSAEATARSNADTNLSNSIGTLSNLNTANKSNLVSAINEVLAGMANAGIKKVQRGTVSVTSNETKNITISSVNMTKSFVLLDSRITAGGWQTSGDVNCLINGSLTSSTNLAITGGYVHDTSWAQTYEVCWQVVEFN